MTKNRHGIFISYRRQDSKHLVGRLYDRLITVFGEDVVFRDIDSIPYGADLSLHIEKHIRKTSVFLIVIGQNWLAISSNGKKKIENPNDWVRKEIESAISDPSVHTIPVLVDEAELPDGSELPASIKPILLLNSISLREDPDFHADLNRLISEIAKKAPKRTPSLSSIERIADARKKGHARSISHERDKSRVIVLLRGIMDHGGSFWAYVAVIPSMLSRFNSAQHEGNIDIYNFDEYGELIIFEEGDHPPSRITEEVCLIYDIDISTFFSGEDPLEQIDEKLKSQKSIWRWLLE